jgi:hypothetical protein
MNNHAISARALAMLPCLFFLPAMVAAQQTPVTGQMMGQADTALPPSGGYAPAPPVGNPATPSADVPPTVVPPVARIDVPSGSSPPRPAKPAPHVTEVGQTTRSLLQMQANGVQAGNSLPMLGAEASASYDRYLKSFSHEIPEFYKTAVGKDSNGNGGGQ